MSLNHKFYVVPKHDTSIDRVDKSYYVEAKFSEITLQDDFVLYIYDSLKWINAFNPYKKEFHFGLNYHGITIIKEDGIDKLEKITIAWIMLFENATEDFILRGRYVINGDKGYYQKLKMKKETILEKLYHFNRILKDALDENKYIVHFGI